MNDRIIVTYLIETPLDVETAAESLAGEQSTGTFIAVPGETADLRERHRARIEKITPLEVRDTPSLPGAKTPQGSLTYKQAEVVVSFPLSNMGTNLPTLLSTVAGNLYELREFSGLKLLDIEFPQAYADAYVGPQFGIDGTRRLADVYDRPIIGTIVKPSVGLSPDQTATLVQELVDADIDFIKDDELQADSPHSPFDERVDAVMRVVNAATERTGKKAMIAFNITDELDAMLRHHDKVVEAG
ncbi:MAG: RuBisCO large subunit C-terminal-like domain-containing protein, partial [Candidatus Poribacteria bacterium]|nr:RuBisCO large subunit C-terminal-like domain-containing protein [Candidatus Poribacteria bacterium]